MVKYGFTNNNRLVIHQVVSPDLTNAEHTDALIKGFKKAFKDPRYKPGQTIIFGMYVSDSILNDPESSYRVAKAISAGKPRLLSVVLHGNEYVGAENLNLVKSLLKPMGIQLDWHHDLQSTLSVHEEISE